MMWQLPIAAVNYFGFLVTHHGSEEKPQPTMCSDGWNIITALIGVGPTDLFSLNTGIRFWFCVARIDDLLKIADGVT